MAILVETIKADDDATLVASLGFTDKQVDAFLAGLATEQQGEDDLPKRRGRARTKRGDLWLMGDHRIICGSSTEGETLERLMHGLVAAMTLTDPPYGIDYEAESGAHEPIRGDRLTDDALINDLLAPAFTLAARHTRPDGAYYVFHSTNRRREFEVAMQRAGLVEHATIIWAKPSTACRGDYRYAHEPCFYAAKSDQRPRFFGDKAQQTVWRIGFATKDSPITVLGTGLLLLDGTGSRLYLAAREPKGRKMRKLRLDEGPIFVADEAGEGTVWEVTRDGGGKHPTQKPVEFCRRAIRNSSERDDIILDPFIGSGTTIMAADSIDRRCFGVEIDPRICDVAVARWEESAGRKAERQRPR
jgi:DNA modification methylase